MGHLTVLVQEKKINAGFVTVNVRTPLKEWRKAKYLEIVSYEVFVSLL